jgi:hypothetical protein
MFQDKRRDIEMEQIAKKFKKGSITGLDVKENRKARRK